jgi:hypothetical protein
MKKNKNEDKIKKYINNILLKIYIIYSYLYENFNYI